MEERETKGKEREEWGEERRDKKALFPRQN